MKVFLVFCTVLVPLLGHLIQPNESKPPAREDVAEIENRPPQLSPRVVNGKFATATQFPWQVSIQPLDNDGTALIRCSGSLISSNRILTVAHCVRDYATFQLGFGSININAIEIVHIVNRTNVVIHPRYNDATLNNDLAIIRMNYDVSFSTTVQAIRLPSRSQNDLDYFVNKAATVSGWGRISDVSNSLSDLLKFTNLNVTTNEYCRVVYGPLVIVNSTVCGVGIPANSGPCGGDSGGPLVLTDGDGVATQIGLFSFIADFGCSSSYPAGFTYIAPYLDWISLHTGISIRD